MSRWEVQLLPRPLSRSEVRSIDLQSETEFHLPTLVLMENAGREAAVRLRKRLLHNEKVLIACGPGGNGGDGAVVARYMSNWGYRVDLLWFTDPGQLQGNTLQQRQILDASNIKQTMISSNDRLADLWNDASWIVDGLFGTGLNRPLDGFFKAVIDSINMSALPVMALDLPSGLDADTGMLWGAAIQATFTTTFVAPKLGFLQPAATRFTGDVEVIDIGVPEVLRQSIGT